MTEQKFAKLRAKLEDAEQGMLRAVRKWDKLRAQVRRAEKALDKDFERRAASECHLDEMARAAGVHPRKV